MNKKVFWTVIGTAIVIAAIAVGFAIGSLNQAEKGKQESIRELERGNARLEIRIQQLLDEADEQQKIIDLLDEIEQEDANTQAE